MLYDAMIMEMDAFFRQDSEKDFISFLSKSNNFYVMELFARVPSTPPKILEKIAECETDEIRWPIAENPNTPSRVLDEYAKVESTHVRYCVAQNPSTSKNTLKNIINFT